MNGPRLRIFRSLEEASASAGFDRLAIGFFDGLHLGHQRVILQGQTHATLEKTCVFTFDPHPLTVIDPSRAPELLTGLPQKLRILQQWGVGSVLLFPFNTARATESAGEFLEELSLRFPFLHAISVGTRWRFGHNRQGDIAMLANWCLPNKIELDPAEAVSWQGEPISSSRIREAIHAGDLEAAAAMLGRPYQLFGYVEEGRQLGQELGFPTLNMATEDECLPPFGVYAGYCLVSGDERLPCVMNIGIRPTVASAHPRPVIEAHLLDFDEDLYGTEIILEPQKFLRPEQKFASLDALREAIGRDVETARAFLKSSG